MSAFDPLSALASDVVASAQAAFEDAALNLGTALEALRAQISVGDLITATVLPAENGNDRLSLLGQTVVAQLPPGIYPGESLLLQVTGFQGSQVLVHNLGLVDPANPPATVNVEPPPASPTGAPQTAILTTQPPPSPTPPQQGGARPVPATPANVPAPAPPANASAPAPPASVLPQTPTQRGSNGSATPIAPPREVFVAASVRSTGAPPPPPIVVPPASGLPTERVDVEARIALSRAAAGDASAPVRERPATIAGTPVSTPPIKTPIPPPATPVAGRVPIPPPLDARTIVPSPRIGAERPLTPTVAVATPETALLTRLRIPITPATLAAARAIADAAQALPRAYERLDSLLARVTSSDPRVNVLRSLLPFIGKFDLGNTRALPEQIASFVTNVVGGAEAKIAAIVRALAQAELPPTDVTPASANASENAPTSANAAAVPLTLAHTDGATPTTPDVPVNVQARVAERMVALDHDFKSALLALIQTPTAGAPPQLAQALSEALNATTGVQLGVLAAQNNDPNTIAIPLPAMFYEGGRPTQLRISRDAPGGKRALDADNFHIAFVLDTQSLGTVAIDLQTVGRAVSVNVKTERTTAADRFRASLTDLRGRLEGLRYRVASIGADVAPAGSAAKSPEPSPGVPPPDKPSSNVDMRA